MPKMRIHEVAKLFGKSSNEVIAALKQQGMEVKSHMSTITDERVEKLRPFFSANKDSERKPRQEQPAAKMEETRLPKTDNQARPQAGRTESDDREMRSDKKPDRDARGNDGRRNDRDRMARSGEANRPSDGNRSGDGRKMDRSGRPADAGRDGNRPARNVDGSRGVRNAEGGRDGRSTDQGRTRRFTDGSRDGSRDGRSADQSRTRRFADGSRDGSRDGRRPERGERSGDNRGYRSEGGRSGDARRGDNRDRNLNRNADGSRGPRNADGRDGRSTDQGRTRRFADGSRDGRDNRRNDNKGGRFQDQGSRDGRRPERGERSGDNRGYRSEGGRGGDARRTDNRGRTGRNTMTAADLGINTKESRNGNTNRHEINREHNRDNNARGESRDSKGGRNNRRSANNEKNNYGKNNNQKSRKNQKPVKTTPIVKPQKKQEPKEDVIRNITLPDPVSLKDLADACKVAPSVIIKKLFLAGKMVTINTEFSFDEAADLALEYNCIAEEEVQVDVIEELLKEEEEDESKMTGRPPVVCVMGHVDHGKTSLLDYIRSTQVTAGEAGGITQHIGAYVVDINGEKITFLDTPGHEAFTSMRLRGAQATDIAVLVVAADDGVMPQTIEAINHAKAAEVEVIVAVNKIDKEGANVERVKQELTEYGLIAEDWGGSTVFVPVSAKTGEGIEELLEMITLTAEVLELRANPKRMARGLVIEAKLDKGRGSVATVLIQKGTLHVGDTISIGHAYGRVRAMIDDKGNRVQSAGPSVPVEILGLNEVPFSGEVMMAHGSEKEARSTAEAFIAYGREKLLEDTKSKLSLDDLFDQIQAGNIKELNLVVKADVQGSVEAVRQSLMKLSNEEVMIKVIHGGVGAINESDVTLASASNAIIIGFNVRPDAQAKSAAEREKVDMRLYRVIYNAIEDIEAAMKGMLDPVFQEKIIGHLEVRQIYKASGIGTIAGCYVTDGMIQRNSQIRLVRDGIVVYEGLLASLKRFKDDVKEVKSGFECGCVFEKYNDVKEGDQVEAFVMEEIPR